GAGRRPGGSAPFPLHRLRSMSGYQQGPFPSGEGRKGSKERLSFLLRPVLSLPLSLPTMASVPATSRRVGRGEEGSKGQQAPGEAGAAREVGQDPGGRRRGGSHRRRTAGGVRRTARGPSGPDSTGARQGRRGRERGTRRAVLADRPRDPCPPGA